MIKTPGEKVNLVSQEYYLFVVYTNPTSDHAITAVSPTKELWCPEIGVSYSFICLMHKNNTQYILFNVQFVYRLQESNVLHWCNCGSVNWGLNTVNACQICAYVKWDLANPCMHAEGGMYSDSFCGMWTGSENIKAYQT